MHRRARVALISVSLLAGCNAAAPPLPTQSAAVAPLPTQTAVVPVAADVATYRGDSARTGAMPGPGPADDPAIAWTFEAGTPIKSSPVVGDGLVLFVGDDGVVHALALATGEERWSVNLGANASGSPLIEAGLVIVGDRGGNLSAFDLEAGARRWSVDLKAPILGSPASSDSRIVAATADGGVVALEPATGSEQWSTTVGLGVTKSVTLDASTAYLGLAGGELVALALADGSPRWRTRLAPVGEIGTPTVAGGLVYAATGIDGEDPTARHMVAADAATGKVRWSYSSPKAAQPYTAAVVGGRAYVVAEDGLTVALDAASGALLWSTTTESPIEALPAVVDDAVYTAGNSGPVLAIDAATGKIRWTVPIEGNPFGPTISGGYLLVGTSGGTLYAIGGPAT